MEWEQVDNRIQSSYFLVQKMEDHDGIFIIEDREGSWYFLKVVSVHTVDFTIVEQLHQTEIAGVNRIVEYFVVEERCYLIKEYIHGCTLFDEILLQGLYAETDVLNMLLSLCASLRKMYQQYGLVFKDLHPKNVMIQNGSYILVDTETVRLVKENRSSDTQVIGVAGFMAPEQYGFAQSTIQSDMYSLAMIARFAMTGDIPTLVKNQIELDQSTCSKVTQSVLEKMTAFAPEKRYRDYANCMRALRLARKGKRPITGRQALFVVSVFVIVIGIFSWRMTALLLESPVEETAYVLPLEEEMLTESPVEETAYVLPPEKEMLAENINEEIVDQKDEIRSEEVAELDSNDLWKVGRPVVNRQFWDAEVGLPFKADWLKAEYSLDEGMDQYLEDLSVSYLMDEKYIYYRFQYQTEYASRVAMYLASNHNDLLFSFVNGGSIRGINDWVVRLKLDDVKYTDQEANTGVLIDFFDTQPFERMFLHMPLIDEIFEGVARPKYAETANLTNFQSVFLELVEGIDGDWSPLPVRYLDGSEKRIHDVAASVLKTETDIYLSLEYESLYSADVVIFLPDNSEGLQTRIDKGTRIGGNSWTIRIPTDEWNEYAKNKGITKLVMNLMLGSLDNPGSIMLDIP
jgi:serine/threonine protein kinase